MSVIINASSSAGLVMTSDLSGVLTLQQNGVSLPNGGVAPAFSAYLSASQSIPNSAYTKLTFNTELFDTNSNFDNATNYRFTPTVAGYYQVNLTINMQAASIAGGVVIGAIYKNNSLYRNIFEYLNSNLTGLIATGADLIQMNGSTDYIEFYVFQSSGAAQSTTGAITGTNASACLVRGA